MTWRLAAVAPAATQQNPPAAIPISVVAAKKKPVTKSRRVETIQRVEIKAPGHMRLGRQTSLVDDDATSFAICNSQVRRRQMLRNAFVGLAAAVLLGTAFVPDDALAYRGGGARVGAVGVRGGAVAGRGVAYRGAAVGVAGRGAAYRGAAWRGGYPYRGAAIGAAAVGAAAAGAAAYGAYGYYGNNGCYRDTYGNVVCQQY